MAAKPDINDEPADSTRGTAATEAVPRTPRQQGYEDAPHLTPATPSEDARTVLLNQVTWGAVLAGIVAMLVIQLVLNMFGIGLGAATLHPSSPDNPSVSTISVAAGVWWIFSGIIASFVGGYAAGRLAGVPKESTAGWHGLTAWAASTLLIFYLVTSTMGSLIGGAYQTTAGAAAAALQAGTQPGNTQALKSLLGNNTEAAQSAFAAAIRAALTGDEGQLQQAREQAAQAVAQSQNIPIEQARSRVQNYETQYRQLVQQTREKADEAAAGVSKAALVGAIALMLGALAAWLGGRSGAVHPTLTDFVLRGRALRPPFKLRAPFERRQD